MTVRRAVQRRGAASSDFGQRAGVIEVARAEVFLLRSRRNSPEHRVAERKTAAPAHHVFLPSRLLDARDFVLKHSETKRLKAAIKGN
jgi:hypothetical protein